MRTSSTVVLAAGVAAGLVTLPTQADASTRHPRPVHREHPPRPRMEDPDEPDAWFSMAAVARRFAPGLDEPAGGDEEPSEPPIRVPGAGSSRDHHPARHHPRAHRHARAHLPTRARVPWPSVEPPSVCVDVNAVVVRVVVQVGCECAPPPHRTPPPKPSPPPRRPRPPVAARPRTPAPTPPRPPAPPKAPSPSVAPQVHRAVTPRAAVPPRRKNPLANPIVLVVLTVVIAAGAGIAFAR
jgi:hypothetical protein